MAQRNRTTDNAQPLSFARSSLSPSLSPSLTLATAHIRNCSARRRSSKAHRAQHWIAAIPERTNPSNATDAQSRAVRFPPPRYSTAGADRWGGAGLIPATSSRRCSSLAVVVGIPSVDIEGRASSRNHLTSTSAPLHPARTSDPYTQASPAFADHKSSGVGRPP